MAERERQSSGCARPQVSCVLRQAVCSCRMTVKRSRVLPGCDPIATGHRIARWLCKSLSRLREAGRKVGRVKGWGKIVCEKDEVKVRQREGKGRQAKHNRDIW